MNIADAFKAMLEATGVKVIDITRHPYQDELDGLNKLSIPEVKALWDAYDGCNDPGGFSGEAIHCWLNLEGEGGHCAV